LLILGGEDNELVLVPDVDEEHVLDLSDDDGASTASSQVELSKRWLRQYNRLQMFYLRNRHNGDIDLRIVPDTDSLQIETAVLSSSEESEIELKETLARLQNYSPSDSLKMIYLTAERVASENVREILEKLINKL
jgi:hypothetical protein